MLSQTSQDLWLKFENLDAATNFIHGNFPVLPEHYKNNKSQRAPKETQKRLEFFWLLRFLTVCDCRSHFPLRLCHTGEREGYPDFVCENDGRKYFVEVTLITDADTQKCYQTQKSFETRVSGVLDLTTLANEVVAKKNSKLTRYKECTGIEASVLLIGYDSNKALCFDPASDIFDPTKITCQFDEAYVLIPVEYFRSGDTRKYLTLKSR